ncbi:hypothetical protein F2P58_22770 [Vibrio fortis]|uniref:Uncharacterized protein n=1 Tax=Vibrio fortis TaxID=212667 RepID=A0A5N3QSZ3_9VIBR|nr:hypothetical protein [Vibrio fortis]KAB0285347.1 hypothetical protein F2P58_22770 [Vibrio fortis]
MEYVITSYSQNFSSLIFSNFKIRNEWIKNMKKTLVLILSGLAALNVHASSLTTTHAGSGQNWYGPFTLTRVANYWDGAAKMTLHVAETPKTGCATTDTKKMATYYAGTKAYADGFFSAAAAAQAQDKKVLLLLDRACDSRYGLNIHGIEILSD